ncbi:tetratricopeptide repeat protein [Persicobacter diffluens]|uniref:Tetratricopeptide repeat protein n=1 Tax=Persicobacter diffluens TaxID=981 RepID=A0AAN5ALJ5_9BACT|nr:hypothetical protein PEDI_34440 [Persicobacter diffluens]
MRQSKSTLPLYIFISILLLFYSNSVWANELNFNQRFPNSNKTSGIALIAEIEQITDSLPSLDQKCRWLLEAGSTLGQLGRWQEGKHCMLLARGYAQQSDSHLQAAVLYYLGLFDIQLNVFDKALEYLFESLEIRKEQDNPNEEQKIYNALGSIFEIISEYQKAIYYYQNALALSSSGKSKAYIHSNIGVCQMNNQNFKEAEDHLLKADSLISLTSTPYGKANIMVNLGEVYRKKQQHLKSEHCFREAERIGADYPQIIGEAQIGLGNIYYDLEKYDLCETYLRRNLENISSHTKISALKLLADISRKKENFRQYADDFSSYITLKDSVYQVDKIRKLATLHYEFEAAIKDKEISILQKDNELQKRRVYLLFAGVLLGVLLIIILCYRYVLMIKQKNLEKATYDKSQIQKMRLEESVYAEKKIRELQQKKFEETMASKSRELASNAIHLINKNKVLQQVKQNVNQLTLQNADQKNLIKQINKQIDGCLNPQQDWEQFKIHFEKTHPNFFARLKEDFPKLTENDLRFMSFLRANFSTKDIANVLNIDYRSANMTRYRIRKKIALENEQDLMEFVRAY